MEMDEFAPGITPVLADYSNNGFHTKVLSKAFESD